MSEPSSEGTNSAPQKPRRWKRRLKWAAFLAVAVLGTLAFLGRNYIRSLQSLHRVAGTDAYVMDYFCDYHLDEIRVRGMNPHRVEDSCIETLFPDVVVPIANRIKRAYIPDEINQDDSAMHHCSTVTLKSDGGDVFFGRNFDWPHDACLILRIHDENGLSSIAIIDLHYLNLDRSDLDQTTLIERIPLLFSPYYVMDGMNRHGVAISDMSVSGVEPPRDSQKPEIISSTLMRVVLDYAKDTQEAIALIKSYNVHFGDAEVHFMIADSTGHSVIVEFIEGDVKVTPSLSPWQICTNSRAWNRSEQERDNACSRYRNGSELADDIEGFVDHDGAMQVTRSMASDGNTMWTSVYNLKSGNLRFLYKSRPGLEYRDSIPRRCADEQSDAPESATRGILTMEGQPRRPGDR